MSKPVDDTPQDYEIMKEVEHFRPGNLINTKSQQYQKYIYRKMREGTQILNEIFLKLQFTATITRYVLYTMANQILPVIVCVCYLESTLIPSSEPTVSSSDKYVGRVPMLGNMPSYDNINADKSLNEFDCYLETVSGVRYFKSPM